MVDWIWAIFVTGIIVLYFVDVARKSGRKVPEVKRRTKEDKGEASKKIRDLLDRLKERRKEGSK